MASELFKIVAEFTQNVHSYLFNDFSALTQEQKKEECKNLKYKAATAGSLVAPLPIPFADIWTITPIQMAMVRGIGNIYGYRLNEKTIKEVFAVVAGGWLGQQTCLALFKLGMPGYGGIAGMGFVFAWTLGIGYAAEVYFKSGMKASKEEIKKAREEGMKEN